ncbi:hypothetical protein A8L34_11935 [Bacillus sp. FJAT-27264]|uniref:hypothetical protein n=1 Tax=Paenibacillus sp. (strain DSM 101736 / FJAT-27264) TaxID=1850362 RepID=UPI000807DF0D|nr:hypothetical protein [Bacillus sp. FJAT-27264]OBZ14625.1 hypothetical protein A8L34_11935 [Bacillus sp. FJAT-27264]
MVAIIVTILGVIIAAASLVVSILAMKKANKASEESNRLTERNNQFASGQIEIQLSQRIDEAKQVLVDASLKLNELPNNTNDSSRSFFDSNLKTAKERYVNSYEHACGLYNDNKIDRDRFKKQYYIEIRGLFESNSFNDFLHPEGTSRFEAVWRVYKEWNKLENV